MSRNNVENYVLKHILRFEGLKKNYFSNIFLQPYIATERHHRASKLRTLEHCLLLYV